MKMATIATSDVSVGSVSWLGIQETIFSNVDQMQSFTCIYLSFERISKGIVKSAWPHSYIIKWSNETLVI